MTTHAGQHAASARESARQGNGQFGTQMLSEDTSVDLLDGQPPAEVDRAKAHFGRFTSCYYVDRDDQFSPEEIDALLTGDFDTLSESLSDRFEENAHAAAEHEAEEAWNKAYEAGDVSTEWDEADFDDQDEMRQAALELDDTDLVAELTRVTPSQLMRTRLSSGMSAHLDPNSSAWNGLSTFNDDSHEWAAVRRQERIDAVEKVLREHGLDTNYDHVRESISELVDNGPYDWHDGVDLDVIFYGDVSTAAPDSYAGSTTSLTFSEPHVLLIDRFNGSGHDVRLSGSLTRQMGSMTNSGLDPEDAVFTDSTSTVGGYSWDEVCGLHKPAFATEMTRTVDNIPTSDRAGRA